MIHNVKSKYIHHFRFAIRGFLPFIFIYNPINMNCVSSLLQIILCIMYPCMYVIQVCNGIDALVYIPGDLNYIVYCAHTKT